MKLLNISLTKPVYHFGLIALAALFLAGCNEGSGSGSSSDGSSDGGTSARAACLTNDAEYVNTFISVLTTNKTAQGGQLYDKWWSALGFATGPITDHPVWDDRPNQVANTRTGEDTWRCKECHGWDYKGASGSYDASSSHYTGFAGIFSASSKDPIEVFCDIKAGTVNNPDHQFNTTNTGGQMTNEAILYLTKFITTSPANGGMANSDDFINPLTGEAIGVATPNGQTVFTTTAGCGTASCHDADGSINIEDGTTTLGALSIEDPWEVLHQIRYGHPNSLMPAFISSPKLTDTQMRDVLAYSQSLGGGGGGGTLPASDAEKMMLGGLLYDEWFAELGLNPVGNNPLWAYQTSNTRTGLDTWRCKECHGWDYKGKDGAYAIGSSHYTGFNGVFNTAMDAGKDEAYVFDRIKNGIYNPTTGTYLHNFGTYLNDTQITALAYFIKNGGVIDTDFYISPQLKFAQGDPVNGLALFTFAGFGVANGNCELCHGTDGRLINFGTALAPEYLGDLSRDNPWEALHKARFGQPDSNMPAMVQSGLTLDDSVDVVTHLQSLP